MIPLPLFELAILVAGLVASAVLVRALGHKGEDLHRFAELSEQRLKIAELDSQVHMLIYRSNGDLTAQLLDGVPVPAWAKRYDPHTNEFRMVWVNAAYENTFAVDRRTYQGALDSEVWGPRVASHYAKMDMDVINSAECQLGEETIPVPGVGERTMTVMKFPDTKNEVVYGWCFDSEAQLRAMLPGLIERLDSANKDAA